MAKSKHRFLAIARETRFKSALLRLFCRINKVTAPFRHGQRVPEKAMIALSNYQREFEEEWVDKLEYKRTQEKC